MESVCRKYAAWCVYDGLDYYCRNAQPVVVDEDDLNVSKWVTHSHIMIKLFLWKYSFYTRLVGQFIPVLYPITEDITDDFQSKTPLIYMIYATVFQNKLSRKSLETMYFSYVRSILEYADI